MRNTKQRSEILAFLETHHGHFTASEIYAEVRKEDPTISLGTVYRNLGNLVNGGQIREIISEGETTRYDGTKTHHIHFICEKCGAIYDLPPEATVPQSVLQNGFLFDPYATQYYGICNDCQKNNK